MSRYLWAVGKNAEAFRPGDSLTDRYLCQGRRIFLDTQPTVFPENLDEVPEEFLPYLRLSPHQLHIPQVHDWILLGSGSSDRILLLDQAPLYMAESLVNRGLRLQIEAKTTVQLFPSLAKSWATETPLRQLNWLWQIANLWEPMSAERVVSSLLYPELLRVEGPIVRLLELRPDASREILLTELGQFWLTLVQEAHPLIQESLQQLCQQLIQGQIRTGEMLVASLDQSLSQLGQSQQTRTLHIATLSDKGPSRQRNEDACYPDSGSVFSSPPGLPLVIVCDGIGGHQGGDVASNLAIQTIKDHLLSLQTEQLSPDELTVKLEKTVCAANELISQQNDAEQRFDRQRMGTTVVVGLVRAHEIYITHVGDSRAYWITRWGCHQVTQDDDVASREVRIGYSTYPQALQQPSAGSLVQALGMSASNLHPTAQRFILDEDSVFLFCSDGLSDNDRVEEKWEEVILPLLTQGKDLATVSQELVEIANHLNGYDNTTVALVHCQISGTKSPSTLQPSQTVIPSSSTGLQSSSRNQTRWTETSILSPGLSSSGGSSTAPTVRSESFLSDTPTKIPELSDYAPQRQSGTGKLLLGIILLAGVLAALSTVLFGWERLFPQNPSQSSQENLNESVVGTEASPQPYPSRAGLLRNDDVIRLNQNIRVQTTSPDAGSEPGVNFSFIESGSLVYVIRKAPIRQNNQENVWLELAVCATQPGEETEGLGGGQPIDGTPDSPIESPEATEPLLNVPLIKPDTKPANETHLGVTPVSAEGDGLEFEPPPVPDKFLGPGERSWIREADLTPTSFSRSVVESDRDTCQTALSATPEPFPPQPETLIDEFPPPVVEDPAVDE